MGYVRVPIYAHTFASVPSRWMDVPEFLATGWTGDPPKDGGHVVPLSIDLTANLGRANPFKHIARPLR